MLKRTMQCMIMMTALQLSPYFLEAQDLSSMNPEAIADLISAPFIETAKTATPCVVSITTEFVTARPYNHPFNHGHDDFFERFFGFSMPHQSKPSVSFGSGFLVSPDGYIMTNHHVVRDAQKLKVKFNDGSGQELEAQLIGSDPSTDLAIIKVEKIGDKPFSFLNFANSDQVQVGQWVMAIGAPYRMEATVTSGIISAKGRQDLKINDLEDFIQTDAAINPGNSGGPLLNLRGQVVGINTAIASQTGSSIGIGFAVPSNIALNIMQQLIETGAVTRGYLGVLLQPIDPDIAKALGLDKNQTGAIVTEVMKDSPAEKAGLRPGDVIIKINGEIVTSLNKLRNIISLTPPDTKITLTLLRQNKPMDLQVLLSTPKGKTIKLSGVASKIGIEVSDLSPEIMKTYDLTDKNLEGVVVTSIRSGSPAQKAGMTPGMCIMMANHQKIKNGDDFIEALKSVPADEPLLFLVTDKSKVSKFIAVKVN